MSSPEYEDDGPQPSIPHESPAEADCIKILLATDNHIGYMERDPIRGQDSINTFREILQLAVKNDVDFILLAGDLFHENKPSRECLYQVTALLREYTLGDKPVQLELLSDPNDGQADGYSFPSVNYQDPNFNVAIPVFSIHGNHDDPQGASSTGALCALDILSVSGLINYMGKFDLPVKTADAATTGIAVKPVLLRKGTTHLGLYGIGNVKDARMHFELRSNRVRMFMPRDKENWFNILLLHQNRANRGHQESVPESMFDDSINMVVWGHEHDCRITPEKIEGKNYYITQPGSSVATSLSEGESEQKHVALVKIQGSSDFKLDPIPLRTVRPFILKSISLLDVAEKEGLDIEDQMAITKYLRAKVNSLIDKANAEWDERNAQAVEDGEEELPRMLPLIRLKVDTTGVTATSNPIRFGQEFTGRLANPRDVLIFHRSKKSPARSGKVTADQPELSIDDPNLTIGEKLEKVRVETLVNEYLAAQELQLLGEGGMSDAIQTFVEKDDIHAIQKHVSKALDYLMKGVSGQDDVDEDEVEDMLIKAKEKSQQEYAEALKNQPATSNPRSSGTSKSRAKAAKGVASDDSMLESDDYGDAGGGGGGDGFDSDEEMAPPPTAKKAPARKAAATTKKAPAKAPAKKATTTAKGRGKKAAVVDSDDEDDVMELDDDDISEDEPAPKKRTSRATTSSQAAAKKAPAKRTTKAASSSQPPKQSQLTFAPVGRSSRAAATKARGKMVVSDDDD